MRSKEAIETLRTIYRAESRCLVRFLVEEAEPATLDEFDGSVQGLLDAWCRDSRAASVRLERLLRGEDVIPSPGSWPLNFSIYNYLQYRYLVDPVRTRMEQHVARLEAESKGVDGWPGAESAIAEMIRTHRDHLARLAEVAAQRPPAEAPPAQRRQTSANWW